MNPILLLTLLVVWAISLIVAHAAGYSLGLKHGAENEKLLGKK